MINYGKQWIDESDIRAVVGALKSDFLTQGPRVGEFERTICRYTGAKYAVAVSSGTAALHLAVLALEIEPGSEGITSPNTFVATSNALIYGDLKPIFADIDEKTYNIDPEQIKRKITPKTKLIIPVHFAGQSAKMAQIAQIARAKKLYVIEDAAHALGSRHEDASRVGSCKYSDMTAFSFHPVKTITTGEGGAITTNSKTLYKKLTLLRTHGITKDQKDFSQNPGPWHYEMQRLGFNCRLSDIQCALGLSQLKKLDRFITRRAKTVKRYNETFAGAKNITTPYEMPGLQSAFHLYVVKIDFKKIGKSRRKAMEELKRKGVGTQVHYIPVHLQPYYQRSFSYQRGDYPLAESYFEQCLSLPLYPAMTDADIEHVIKSVKEVVG